MNKISMKEIANGTLQEQFNKSFERVFENLMDPNTSFKAPRKITIVMKFTQTEERDNVFCDISVTEKLASQLQTQTVFSVRKDLLTGKTYAEEYGKQISFDVETGEVFEDNAEKIDK